MEPIKLLCHGQTPNILRPPCRNSFADVEVEIAVSLNSASYFYAGYDARDVCGVFVSTYHALQLGTIVSVTIYLPYGASFRTIAAVDWARDPGLEDEGVSPGMGLRFEPLTTHQAALLHPLLRLRTPLFYAED